jgi:FlaA1/EpsC-like NDP-sugar epimerase
MLKRILNKIRYWYLSKDALPYWCVILADFLVIIVAAAVSIYICEGPNAMIFHFWDRVLMWCCMLPFFFIGMRIFHTYSGIIRYLRSADLLRVLYAQLVGFAFILCIRPFFGESESIVYTGLKTYLTTFCLSVAGQWAVRVLMKTIYESSFNNGVKRAFIFGVKEGAEVIASTIQSSPQKQFSIVGFVSPNGDLAEKYMFGVKVRRIGPNLIEHMKKARATVLIVSPLQADNFRNHTELVKELIANEIHIMMLAEAELWTPEKGMKQEQLHEVDIEDLLPRDKIEVDLDAIGALLQGKRILITGAAGSIGSEMVNQVAKSNPAEMVLIDQAETPMHDVRLKMARKYPNIKAWTIVSSISNPTHMEEIFRDHKPEYVFHAAAYKHVPMMEDNPAMAIQNNIYGTRVIADLAVKYGTKKFVMISTDKAVNPTNVMGCSKRICEIYCQSLNKALQDLKNGIKPDNYENIKDKLMQADGTPGVTQFITTRFGNVLGSNGSVIPIFKEQIKNGGPLTVTHPDIIRFFMLIPEACQLVLEAGTMGNGGEIFVFDMGKPVRIADLAQRMIDLSGAKNVQIKYTGLRDGEKLFEEVLNDTELTKPTIHPKIKIASVREYQYDEALKNEEELHELSFTYDDMKIVKKMKEIVPEYKSRQSKYEALD